MQPMQPKWGKSLISQVIMNHDHEFMINADSFEVQDAIEELEEDLMEEEETLEDAIEEAELQVSDARCC